MAGAPEKARRVSEKPVSRGRRSSEHAAETRERILAAGLDAFSEVGFGAASLREIGARAGVNQQLITHHFGNKLGLWQSVLDHVFDGLKDRLGRLEGVEISERVRLLPRELLGFCAEHPEFVRLMTHDAATPGARLEWLLDRHTRSLFDWLAGIVKDAQAAGLARAGDPTQFVYLLIGATTLFAHSSEFELLTGRSSRSQDVIDQHVELVSTMLFPGALAPPSPAVSGDRTIRA